MRTAHGRPDSRLLAVWLHNGWDAVCLTVEFNSYDQTRMPGAADEYDHHLEQSVARLVSEIAGHRLSSSPPTDASEVAALDAYATSGLPLPAPVRTGSNRTVRRAGCTFPGAHMMGLTVPPERAG